MNTHPPTRSGVTTLINCDTFTTYHVYSSIQNKLQCTYDYNKPKFTQFPAIHTNYSLSNCTTLQYTLVPVMNGHPRDQAKVSVLCGWRLIRGTDGYVEMSRDIDNVAVHSRWPLTTGVAQSRYYCNHNV